MGIGSRHMDDREFFCKRHRVEFPTFKKVLEAMPIDRFDYRPHERSPSALELVWILAQELAGCAVMVEEGQLYWAPPPAPAPEEAVAAFIANHEALDQRVQRLTDREWSSSSKLYVGGKF